MANELARNDEPNLALNRGWSSLKFGIYQPGRTDKEPVLTGNADGMGVTMDPYAFVPWIEDRSCSATAFTSLGAPRFVREYR